MPIHFKYVDVVSKVEGLSSALIVPCIFCPAVTLSVRENTPFMQFFRSPLKPIPLKQYLDDLQSRLREKGVHTDVFESYLYHQWLLCVWTSRRRKKLQNYAKHYQAVIVLGCNSAMEIVRDLIKSTDCKLIEGTETAGFTNAKLKFRLPGNVSFEDFKTVPICKRTKNCPFASRDLQHA